MNPYKKFLSLLIAILFLVSANTFAQDAPPIPRTKSSSKKSVKEQEGNKKSDDKKKDDKKSDKKSDDAKNDDKKKDDKSDDKKDDKSDDKPDAGVPRGFGNLFGDVQQTTKNTKKSEDFIEAFESVVASANESTLSIMSGKRQIALGTVVDSDGLILTKASEIRGKLGCKLRDGTIVSAKVIGVDPKSDLALLKVDAEELNVIQWATDTPPPQTGRWVATPKAYKNGKLPTIGVVGVDAREIPPSRPFIGIFMANLEDEDGIRITQVINKSPAEMAGLQVNDVILKLDGEVAKDNVYLTETLKQYDINDRVVLTIRRGKKEMDLKLTLAERDKVSPDSARSNTQNSMGSVLSRRRKDFPASFQHDSMLGSSTCGGPIVDLSGKAVGINIARAGRVSSLALTTDVVLPILERLKTGDFTPSVVNREQIEILSSDLAELVEQMGDLPQKKQRLELGYHRERARKIEVESTIRELKKRLKDLEESTVEEKKELDAIKKELTPMLKNKARLENDLKKLRTGSRY